MSMQKTLTNMDTWTRHNNIRFNASKCKALTITRKKSPLNFIYKLDNVELERVSTEKDVGVTITNSLTWNTHIHAIIAKANEGCPILTNRLQWNIIHSNGIPLVKCMSLRGLRMFLRLQAARGCILLVHWYDWYQWNNPHAIGIPLVKCISLRALRIFSTVSGCEGVHSTCPLVRLV